MTDIFSYNIDVKSKQIVAARNVAVSIGGEKVALVQQVQGSYQHTVQPTYELGASTLYFVNGNPIGNFSCTSLVGPGGWFDGMIKGNACGDMTSINLDITSDNCSVRVTGKSNVKFEGAILTSISFQVSAGGLNVVNSCTWTAAKLQIS